MFCAQIIYIFRVIAMPIFTCTSQRFSARARRAASPPVLPPVPAVLPVRTSLTPPCPLTVRGRAMWTLVDTSSGADSPRSSSST